MFFNNKIMLTGIVLLTLLPFSDSNAADNAMKDAGTGGTPFRISVEYLYPTDKSRDIKTVNLNIYGHIGKLKKTNLSILAGLTATYATGTITQLEGDLNGGTLGTANYDNEAFGVGPSILADLRLWNYDKFAIHLEGTGSILLYNRNFPAGGERYNFMWRGGPVLRYAFIHSQDISIGYLWMHVSNGQGTGSQNPSYDAQGLTLQYSFVF